jgi:hypothetical protein
VALALAPVAFSCGFGFITLTWHAAQLINDLPPVPFLALVVWTLVVLFCAQYYGHISERHAVANWMPEYAQRPYLYWDKPEVRAMRFVWLTIPQVAWVIIAVWCVVVVLG